MEWNLMCICFVCSLFTLVGIGFLFKYLISTDETKRDKIKYKSIIDNERRKQKNNC